MGTTAIGGVDRGTGADAAAWLEIVHSGEGDLYDGRLSQLAVPALFIDGSRDLGVERSLVVVQRLVAVAQGGQGRDGQAKDGQAKDGQRRDWQGKDGQGERRGKRGERSRGEGDQKGQTGPAPAPAAGGEQSGGAAKAQP